MAVNSSGEGQDAYSVAVLPDESTTVPLCESQSFLSLLKVPEPLKQSISLDAFLNSQNKVNREMENPDVYFPCFADMDIEKGKSDTPKTKDEPIGNLKSEDPLTRALQRQISIQMGGNFMQLLMDHSVVLPKFNFREFQAYSPEEDSCVSALGSRMNTPHDNSNAFLEDKTLQTLNQKKINLLLREFMTRQITGRGNISGLPHSIQEKLFSCSQSCRVWEQ